MLHSTQSLTRLTSFNFSTFKFQFSLSRGCILESAHKRCALAEYKADRASLDMCAWTIAESNNAQIGHNVRKHTLWHVCSTKTQISLHIRAVCSEFVRKKKVTSLAIQTAPNDDSHPTVRMHTLILIFAKRTCRNVRFLMLRFKCWRQCTYLACVSYNNLSSSI